MTAPALQVGVLSGVTPRHRILHDLALPRSTPDAELVFELVRAVAWASTQGKIPVAGHVLANRATEALSAADTSASVNVRGIVEAAIDGLESIGDLADLGGGQWACVPTYAVTTPNSLPDLLISGLPSRVLEPALRQRLVAHGPSRRLASTGNVPTVPFATWTRRPQGALLEWTKRTLAGELRAVDPSATTTAQPVFYHSGLEGRGKPQDRRWRPPGSYLSGRHLARVTGLTGSVEYQLCELDRGHLISTSPCDSDTARRLMYGIDMSSGGATRAKVRSSDKEVTIHTTNPLPRGEARTLFALARRARTGEWVMPADYPLDCPVLGSLGIELISD